MWRARVNLQSTEFSFSRFLTPYLCNFEGWAIFLDCDMLFLDDISKLWDLREDKYAVQCVKHNHIPEEKVKFLNQTQTVYEKKNWSSVMLLNCSKCRMLTPEYVNTASGLELHCFRWLSDDQQIGDIPHRWNHLVDYDPEEPIDKISNLHFTSGGPYYEEYKNCGYASTWRNERDDMLFANKG
jgi:lipopolysaccharide biosynthesis glycosyltransferase